jgi:hypothetical protein
MRRFVLILASCVCLQLAAASPAHAWWDYIEQFSGPGPFKGFDIEARLICWHEDTDPDNDDEAKVSVFVPGAIISACKRLDKNERRRASLDLGMRFVWKGDDPKFADGERISLTTFEPAFSWNPIPPGRYDWFDVGFGAGIYWISSKGFPSVSGAFLEPARLDFHAPSSCESRWCGLLVVRASMLVFPGGFEPGAFAARADVDERISRDWVPALSLFVDLERLMRR